jgi:hypothetical protein
MDCFGNRRISRVLAIWIAGLTMLFGGCATLDKDECLHADWQSIGYEDGARGYKASRIASHRKACAKHGIAPDFDRYEAGRLKGLEEWCTPRNGYQQGVRGHHYNGVCPESLEGPFMEALAYGKDVHAYASQVERQEEDLKKMVADLGTLQMDLAAMEEELVRSGVSPRRRRHLLAQIRRLEDDQRLSMNDIADMEHTLEDMQAHLAHLKDNNPYR